MIVFYQVLIRVKSLGADLILTFVFFVSSVCLSFSEQALSLFDPFDPSFGFEARNYQTVFQNLKRTNLRPAISKTLWEKPKF